MSRPRESLDYDTWLQQGPGGPDDSDVRVCDCGHSIEDHEDGALCHLCGCTVPLFFKWMAHGDDRDEPDDFE